MTETVLGVHHESNYTAKTLSRVLLCHACFILATSGIAGCAPLSATPSTFSMNTPVATSSILVTPRNYDAPIAREAVPFTVSPTPEYTAIQLGAQSVNQSALSVISEIRQSNSVITSLDILTEHVSPETCQTLGIDVPRSTSVQGIDEACAASIVAFTYKSLAYDLSSEVLEGFDTSTSLNCAEFLATRVLSLHPVVNGQRTYSQLREGLLSLGFYNDSQTFSQAVCNMIISSPDLSDNAVNHLEELEDRPIPLSAIVDISQQQTIFQAAFSLNEAIFHYLPTGSVIVFNPQHPEYFHVVLKYTDNNGNIRFLSKYGVYGFIANEASTYNAFMYSYSMNTLPPDHFHEAGNCSDPLVEVFLPNDASLLH